ncbi:family 43 glycosylhydrolase [Microbacterium dextranolyticum]|uniref:CBM6 domain-containing protein n=1 Tax=Microbacterium dextranolyticum TaxID=36806 RepID=A0A9W6M6M2_9MICO|nr:family 43 glycosylhydrolase [Microbacterium dextranolyticum]MBM7464056.1 arabinoxylan arabinofuranohydrolase [Microbacterium dextranolyticum]GLJ96614.1 hypothetical protein GCM10017591_26770 [Microbacterium dextranolyticum]
MTFAAAIAGVALAWSAVTPPATAADTELIVNGGFESGISSWFVNNGNATDGGQLAVVSDPHAGASAVQTTGRKTTGTGPMQDLSGKVQSGKTYTVSAWVKYDNAASPATKQFFATMHYGGGTYTNLASVQATRGQWSHIQGNFTIPSAQSTATARIFFETPWTSDPASAPDTHLMDFVLDDVSLVGAAPPAAPSKTIEVVGKLPGEHNPLIGHKFGADGFGYAENGRVYMFMTNDTQGYAPDPVTGVSPQINYGSINQITLISSEDLVNWTDHGEIQVAGSAGVAPFTNNSWAPGFAKKKVNGQDKYFLYYANGGGSSNVITGASPLGPWTSERSSTLIDGSTPGAESVAWKFDPAPLVDKDGKAYLYFGGGPASTSMPASERFNNPKNIRVIELGDDMVSTKGSAQVVDTPVSFEAAQVFEREGKYYLSYSSHFGGNDFGGNQAKAQANYPGGGEIGYLMSDSPTNFPKETYAGVLFPNQGQFFGAGTGGNNHQSVFEFNGKYYFTYHAPTLNKRINGNTTQGYRSPHIQEMAFNADGTIKQVVGDYAGVAQVHDFDPFRVFEAETFGWSKGIATEKIAGGSTQFGSTAPNLVVKDIDAGDWTGLSSVAFGEKGAASVTVKAKPLQAGGKIEVRSGSATGTVLGTISVDGPIGEWSESTATLTGATGTHDVYFTYTGGTGDLFELDTFSFAAAQPEPQLAVTATATTRCVAGKVVLAVSVTGDPATPVTAAITTPAGTRTLSVGAGKTATAAVSTRAASFDAGQAEVVATAADGSRVSVSAPYTARSCG